MDTNRAAQPNLSLTAPATLQPFFDDMSDSESQTTIMSSLKVKPHSFDSQTFHLLCVVQTSLTLFLLPSVVLPVIPSVRHSILAERGGVSALRPAHTVHPSLSQSQHFPLCSALQSMSSPHLFLSFFLLECITLTVYLSFRISFLVQRKGKFLFKPQIGAGRCLLLLSAEVLILYFFSGACFRPGQHECHRETKTYSV